MLFWVVEAALLAPALLLTLTRLVEPGGARLWIQIEAFTPLAIVLYATALLVAGLRLLLGLRRRWSLLVVALIAVGGLALHGWWFAPQVTGANPPPADGATPYVVVTANLLEGAADGVDLVRRLSTADVDLLVLEEVTAAELADMERAGLDELLPYRAGVANTAATGTMAFSRTEITDIERIPTVLDGWTFRTADLVVVAVHVFPPTDADNWRADHAVLAETVSGLQPDLVVGDLNSTADHAPLRALSDAGYRDVGELANEVWTPTWPTQGIFDLLGTPLAQIDHVLVGPRLAALDLRTEPIPQSDHRAVIATVARK